MAQNVNQNVQVNVHVGRRRKHWFPLLGVIGFTIAMFWPKAVWHGLPGDILEGVWLVVLAVIWSLVLILRSLP
jgi:hypothetical protein